MSGKLYQFITESSLSTLIASILAAAFAIVGIMLFGFSYAN